MITKLIQPNNKAIKILVLLLVTIISAGFIYYRSIQEIEESMVRVYMNQKDEEVLEKIYEIQKPEKVYNLYDNTSAYKGLNLYYNDLPDEKIQEMKSVSGDIELRVENVVIENNIDYQPYIIFSGIIIAVLLVSLIIIGRGMLTNVSRLSLLISSLSIIFGVELYIVAVMVGLNYLGWQIDSFSIKFAVFNIITLFILSLYFIWDSLEQVDGDKIERINDVFVDYLERNYKRNVRILLMFIISISPLLILISFRVELILLIFSVILYFVLLHIETPIILDLLTNLLISEKKSKKSKKKSKSKK